MADSYATRRKSLDRRQKLLEAMTGMSNKQLGPGQMVGDHFVPTSLFDALGQAGQAGLAAYGQSQADKQSQELDKERTQILRDALEKAQTQDAAGRVGTLMGSEVPELQQMGMKQFEAMIAPGKPEKFRGLTTVMGPDGKPMLVQAGDQGSVKKVEGMMPFERPMAVRGELINPLTRESYGMFGQAPAGTTVNVTTNMPPAEKEFDKALGKGTAEEILQARKARTGAIKVLRMANDLNNQNQKELVSGPLAKPAVWAGRLARGMGFAVPDAVKNSEVFDNIVSQRLTDEILNSDVGRGFTDTDREYAISSYPNLMQTPEGRQAIINHMRNSAQRTIEESSALEEAIRTNAPRLGNIQNMSPSNQPVNAQGNLPQTQGPVQIRGDADYDKLPSGTEYIDPNGVTRRKK